MPGKSLLRLRVDELHAGRRLDQALVGLIPALSRARAQKLIASKKVCRVDSSGRRRPVAKGELVQCGDVLELESADIEQPRATADHDLSLRVVLLSDDVVIVDKPAGMPSAPRDGAELGCVANGLVAAFPEMAQIGYGPLEPGLCHRLDNDTSGLILAARHADAFDELTHAIRSGRVDKTYELICADGPELMDDGEITWPIAPHATNPRKMVTCPGVQDPASRGRPRPATTRYTVLQRDHGRAHVRASAASAGRHQLRIHFASLGCPLLGDMLYGGERVDGAQGHVLHATSIRWSGGQVPSFSALSSASFNLLALCTVCGSPTSP
ncbi:MAG: RluA family pseudouridine synthase [Polyangiaceae bacterium]